MNDKQNNNFEDIYLLKLSDLNLINNFNQCNSQRTNPIRLNDDEYFFTSPNKGNFKDNVILVRLVNKNDKPFLEDILTETKIIVFADYASNSIANLKQQNLTFIAAETCFQKISYNGFIINGLITEPIALNYLTNTLFVNFNNLKSLKNCNENLLDYAVKDETKLTSIRNYIEALKQIQNRNIHNILDSQEYHHTIQTVKQHLFSISKDFEGFSKELKKKRIKLSHK